LREKISRRKKEGGVAKKGRTLTVEIGEFARQRRGECRRRVDVPTKKWCWQKQKTFRAKREVVDRQKFVVKTNWEEKMWGQGKAKKMDRRASRNASLDKKNETNRGGVPPWHQKLDDAWKYFLLPWKHG
jgi:hypothetical protein